MNRRAAVVALFGVLLLLTAVWVGGYSLTKPARHPAVSLPAGLPTTPVTIPAPIGPPVQGWLVTANANAPPNPAAILLLHSVRSNRTEMFGRAQFLHRLGHHVLLVDLPAHGETTGDRITFGARESAGVIGSIDFLRQRFPGAKVGVIGASLGGAALLLAEPIPRVDAAVLEAVYPDIDAAIANRLRLHLGTWSAPLAGVLSMQLPWHTGVTAQELRPIERIAQLKAPLLVMGGELDEHTPAAETRSMFESATAPKELWIVPGARHVNLHQFAPQQYEARVGAFLARRLQ